MDEGKEYDQERTQRLEGYGLRVIRFTNQQVLQDFEGICEAIPPFKGGQRSSSFRNC